MLKAPKIFIFIYIIAYFLIIQNSARAGENLQKGCEKILGDNPGAIIVYDIKEDRMLAVVNREIAFRRAYRPGSLFKLITAAALLEEGIDPRRKINCQNYYEYMGKKYTCSLPGGHGYCDLPEALGESCSIYFYRQSPLVTPQKLRKTALKFGLARALPPKNYPQKVIPGRVSPPADPRLFINFAVGDEEGIAITPWQGANLISMAATGKSLCRNFPSPKFKKNTERFLKAGMKLAGESGTCSLVKKAGIEAYCKTGTATNEQFKEKYHGWFGACFPMKSPRYVVLVFLQDGRGYTDAVPLGIKVIKLMSALFNKKSTF